MASLVTECVNLVLKHKGDVFAAYASIMPGVWDAMKRHDDSDKYLIALEKEFKEVIVEAAMKEHGYEQDSIGVWKKKQRSKKDVNDV